LKTNLLKRMTVAAVLSTVWLMGTGVKARAQEQQEHPHEKEMKKREKQDRKEAKRREKMERKRGHYGRIPDDRYRAHFGREHRFRVTHVRVVEGYHRFAYGGYTFGYAQPLPRDWRRDDDVYVEYVNGGYFLCNQRRPGLRISLTIF
jgi:Ni/Co efflux regulator RcnB